VKYLNNNKKEIIKKKLGRLKVCPVPNLEKKKNKKEQNELFL